MGVKVTLAGKTALVTGAGSGIGKATAIRLAQAGAKVCINDIIPQTAKKTVQKISESFGIETFTAPGDVSIREHVKHIGELVANRWNGVDILINNVGIAIRKPLAKLTLKDWDRIMAVNLRSMFLCSQTFVPFMKKNRWGRIVNIASTLGMIALPPRTAYSASKAAVMSLTRELAAELAPYKINVNAIGPGWVKTAMTHKLLEDRTTAKALLSRVPLKRYAGASEIADVALFLCSGLSSYITGQTIMVEGGETIL